MLSRTVSLEGRDLGVGEGIDRPLFVVAAPCAGASILFELIGKSDGLGTLSSKHRSSLRALMAGWAGETSAELDAEAATPERIRELRRIVRAGVSPSQRWLSAGLSLAGSIPFLNAAFPEARFIYLYRDPREQLERMLTAQRALAKKRLAGTVVAQWSASTERILASLAALPDERWTAVALHDVLKNPETEAYWLARFAEFPLPKVDWKGRAGVRELVLAERDSQALSYLLPTTSELGRRALGAVQAHHPSLFELAEREQWARSALGSVLGQRRSKSAVPRTLVAGAFAAAASIPAAALAAPFTVLNNNDSGVGSLRQAIVDANNAAGADDITFDSGVTGTITLTGGQLYIKESVTITGPGADVLTISGNDDSRVFYLYTDGGLMDVTISGLTIESGLGGNGACIVSYGESLTLDSVVIQDCNSDGAGGGVYVSGSTTDQEFSIKNSEITGSTAAYGGAIALYDFGGTASIDKVTLSGNHAIQAGGALYAFTNDDASITITDSTITGNSAGDPGDTGRSGGALRLNAFSTGEQISIDKTTISENSANGNGGGIQSGGVDTLLITGSTIANNTSIYYGGGVQLYSESVAEIKNTIISGNSAGRRGGAISLFYSKVTIEETTIAQNLSASDGGGLRLWRSSGLVQRSTISENFAGEDGGGGSFMESSVELENSTVSGNKSAGYGGGLYASYQSDVVLRHTTIVGNSATNFGGGLYSGANTTVTVENTIIANNSSLPTADIGGSGFDISYSLIEKVGDAGYSDNGGNVFDQDPDLGALVDNYGPTLTHLPNASSPAVDSGDPAFVAPPDTDQRTLPRVHNTTIDMGAVERIVLANGEDVPGGTCSAGLGKAVCESGVCDTADDKCGYGDGDGLCDQNTVDICRSGTCGSESHVCIPSGGNGCATDGDCAADETCNKGSFTCEASSGTGGAGGTPGDGGSSAGGEGTSGGAPGAAGAPSEAGTPGDGGTPSSSSGGSGNTEGGAPASSGKGGKSSGGKGGTGGTGGTGAKSKDSSDDGGCGCQVPGLPANSNGMLVMGMMVAAAAIRRRRKNRRF